MTLLERFMKKVKVDTATGCWLWTGSIDDRGYGVIRVDGKAKKAHRVSWELHRGKIGRGKKRHDRCVLHKCDVRKCVNPEHLFRGTQKQNNKDMARKGRAAHRFGEANPRAKLTRVDAQKIRERFAVLGTRTAVAKEFHVHLSTVGRIISGKRWRP